ncbi:MAG: hypothetical protein ACI4TC_10945 [Kiritimatiellia bacterium]
MKTVHLSARMLLGSVIAVCATAVQAINGEDWLGEGEDTLASNSANWQGGRAADSTAAMRFQNPPGRTVTFDQLYTVGSYVWVGDDKDTPTYFSPATETTAEVFAPVIWQASDPTFGIHQTRSDSHFRWGDADNQNSALQIKSGTYSTDAQIWLGCNGAKAKLVMNGGSLACAGNFLMATGKSSAYGVLTVNGGEIKPAGDLILSSDGATTRVTVGSGDAEKPAKVVVRTDKWAKLTKDDSDSGSGHLTLKAGGEFHCGFLQMNAADSQVIFDGGTFVKDGDVSNTMGSLFGCNADADRFSVLEGSHLQVTANGGTLDIGNTATRIDMPLILAEGATSGTLVTKGAARLTLNGADRFGGTLHVGGGGCLQLKAGDMIGGLEIEDDAFVYFPAVAFAEETTEVTLLTVKADISALADKIVCPNAEVTLTVAGGETTVTATPLAEGAPVKTFWIGSTSDNWGDGNNWSDGVPTDEREAVVLKSVLIRTNADRSAKKITIGKDCTLTFHKSGNWPVVRAEEIVGPGKLVISSCGIKPIAGKTLKLYADVETDATVAGVNQDCWIEGNDETSRLELHGTLTATKSAFRVNQAMDIYGKIVVGMTSDDDNYIQTGSVVKPGGEIVILEGGQLVLRDSIYAEGSKLNVLGALTLTKDQTFAGNLTGTGTVEVQTPFTLTGNNESFAGTVNKPWKEALNFDAETAGSPLATWNIGGDCATSLSEGTIKFGQIDYHQKDDWFVFYADAATVEGKYVTLEIGAKGGNSNLGTAERVCNSGNNVNLRKVGTGNLDLWFNTYKKIDLHEGTATFRNNNGPSEEYTFTGGTMKLPYLPNWAFLDRIKNSTSPVAIDTDGVDLGFYRKGTIDSSNVGGFTKLGDGTLTIWDSLAYVGPTTVKGGKLFIKGGLGDENAAVTVDEGATLNLYVDHITFTDGEAVKVFNGTVDPESVTRITVSGVNKEMTVSAGSEGAGIFATSAPADDAVPNRWVGLDADNWTTWACWSKGVPVDGQTIQIDYTARIANIQGSINLNKIIVAAGAEAQFVTRNYNTHPSLGFNALEVLGEGEATIALDHCGIESRDGRYKTPANLNFRMVSTTTDSWLRDLDLQGRLVGNGILRPYNVNFYGDNSDFEGRIIVLDAGSRICATAASLPKGVLELAHDISLDIMEGTFKIGSLDTHEEHLCYTKNGSTAVIEVGHRNEDFGRADSTYYFGPETYNAIDVPELTFKKVGTGTWTNAMKGLRHIIVEEGELALVDSPCGNHMFDNNHGYEIDTLVVKAGATLSGSAGNQPIKALTLEEGAILKATVAEATEGEGESVVTTRVASPLLTVDGDVTIDGKGAIVDLVNANLVQPGDRVTLLSASRTVTGCATLKDGLELPTDDTPNASWRVRNRGNRLELGGALKTLMIIVR